MVAHSSSCHFAPWVYVALCATMILGLQPAAQAGFVLVNQSVTPGTPVISSNSASVTSSVGQTASQISDDTYGLAFTNVDTSVVVSNGIFSPGSGSVSQAVSSSATIEYSGPPAQLFVDAAANGHIGAGNPLFSHTNTAQAVLTINGVDILGGLLDNSLTGTSISTPYSHFTTHSILAFNISNGVILNIDSSLTGFSSASSGVETSTHQEANFSFVVFAVVPEPSSLTLAGIAGIIGLFGYGWMRCSRITEDPTVVSRARHLEIYLRT